jgi:hypothetical protein
MTEEMLAAIVAERLEPVVNVSFNNGDAQLFVQFGNEERFRINIDLVPFEEHDFDDCLSD